MRYEGAEGFLLRSENFAHLLILLRLAKNSNFRCDHYHKKVIFFLMGVLRNSNNFVILFPGIKQVEHSSIMICSITGILVKTFRFLYKKLKNPSLQAIVLNRPIFYRL